MTSKEEVVSFSSQIEKLAKNKNLTIMDAIVFHCETTGLEIEVAAKLLTEDMKLRIRLEAEGLNYLEPLTEEEKRKIIENSKKRKKRKVVTGKKKASKKKPTKIKIKRKKRKK